MCTSGKRPLLRTAVTACSSTQHCQQLLPFCRCWSPLPAVTAHLTGLHSAIKMLAAKLVIIQQQVEDVAEGETADVIL
jgi:hypothetical protein